MECGTIQRLTIAQRDGRKLCGEVVETMRSIVRERRALMVDHDRTDCVHLLVRLEVQQIVGDRAPHAGCLVGFTGVGGDEVLELFRRLHQGGQTIVLVTHDQPVADAAQRIVRMKDGRVVDDG